MKSKTVALEIGHGLTPQGFDPGAMAYGNVISEYELNKIAALSCQKRLAELNIESVIIDEPLSLTEIGKLAKGYACFVSIHHNSFNGKAQGVETLYDNKTSDDRDIELAKIIQSKMIHSYSKDSKDPLKFDRGAKPQGLAVLKGANSVGTVACLVECYFIDSIKWDRTNFIYHSKICGNTIGEGVAEWHHAKFSNTSAATTRPTYSYLPATLPLTDSYVEIVRALQGLGDAPKKSLSSAEFDHAVRVFQQKHSLVVDGDVGPKTLAALELALSLARGNKSEPIKTDIAKVTRTNQKDEFGCYVLRLQVGNDIFNVVSGQPYAQKFRLPSDPKSIAGCMEPIPQGEYKIGTERWADGVDNYDASQGNGLGAWTQALVATFKDDRNLFALHLDSNRFQKSPGSAGCICTTTIADTIRLVAALRKFQPTTLIVDWGI